jgi:segregation and condensation protein B
MMKEEKKLIEAALFISSRAMTLEEFRSLTGIGALGYLQGVVQELRKDYEERGSAIEIIEADGKYSMRVRNEQLSRVKQYAQDTEISKSALRTLAYLSKHEGMLKSELVRRVGTHAYSDVKELIGADFVRAQRAGRTSKLTLTEKFRRYFVTESAPAGEAPQTTL